MDRTDYVLEAQQLSDTTYYVPLQRAISPETADLVSDILERLRERGFLSKRQVTYLKGAHPHRPRYFYLLPKIHKPLEKWTVPQSPSRTSHRLGLRQ